MCRTWLLDNRNITAKSPENGGDTSEPSKPGEFSVEERKRRSLSFLTRNMAGAIATAVLQEEGMTSEPDVDAYHDE